MHADLALLHEVMTRNQAGFDKALLTALKGHKHYYSVRARSSRRSGTPHRSRGGGRHPTR